MKLQDRFCLTPGGKRHWNAHDRRRRPTAKERRRLARRWRRSAEDRRACLLKREAYNTWTGRLTGWPVVEAVEFEIGGQRERHGIGPALNAWRLMVELRKVGRGALSARAKIMEGADCVVVRAHNYGVRLMFTSTPGLEWTEVVAATSGAVDRMPERYKITGRAP